MDTYTPGVCNIGPAEIAARQHSGWIMTTVTLVVFLLFFFLKVPNVWRLILFFPLTGAASGFLQGYYHFCAGYGFSGLYNVVKPLGETESVEKAEFRKADRAKALNIIGNSAVIGAVLAVILVIL